MNLEMDFVRQNRLYTWQGAVVFAVGLCGAIFGVQQYASAGRDIAAFERELAIAHRSGSSGGAGGTRGERAGDLDQLRARIVLANQVVRKKAVPWDALFRDIESASNSRIGLLAVQPDPATGLVRISGEARDTAALTDYIERLEAQPSLKSVHLVEHEVKQEQGRAIVRFNLNATWASGHL